MNPTITTEELLALTKSADLLRRTAEKAMRFDEAERLLTEHIRSWERLQNAMPEPDINDTPEPLEPLEPLVKRVAQRLNLVDALKEEVVTAGNHAACRLNVLGEIHRILGSDGGTTGVCALTGVPPQLYRLPKRVEQLVGELHGTRNDRDHLAGILEKVARACDGDDPLDFPQLPQKVAELAKEAAQGQSWRDEFVKAENKANRAEERANSAGLQVIALDQELNETKTRNRGLWERAGAVEKRVNELLHENLDLKQKLEDAVSLKNQLDARIGELLRENETLARNMPPEPPADAPVVMTYDPTCFQTTKVIGQVWCQGSPSEGQIGLVYPGGWMVLCNVHQDTTTGALTYRPVAAKDLPLVQ